MSKLTPEDTNLIRVIYDPNSLPAHRDLPDRLDQFLAKQLQQFSRAQLQKLIADGKVFVGGKVRKASYRLRPGEEVVIGIPPPAVSKIEAQSIPLDIVYEDDYLAVVNKQAGMVVHPGAGVNSGTLVHALLHHMRSSLSGIGGILRPGIVHRLDKDTSGLLVVAKNDFVHQHLSKQIQSKQAKRHYLAILEGALPARNGLVDKPIGRHPRKRTEMGITKTGRAAQTVYSVIDSVKSNIHPALTRSSTYFSLVQLQLATGRTHQIRVHMASINCPVAGDIVYNQKLTGSLKARDKLMLKGHALHALQLSFAHPISGQSLEFQATLPEDLQSLISRLFPDSSFLPL